MKARRSFAGFLAVLVLCVSVFVPVREARAIVPIGMLIGIVTTVYMVGGTFYELWRGDSGSQPINSSSVNSLFGQKVLKVTLTGAASGGVVNKYEVQIDSATPLNKPALLSAGEGTELSPLSYDDPRLQFKCFSSVLCSLNGVNASSAWLTKAELLSEIARVTASLYPVAWKMTPSNDPSAVIYIDDNTVVSAYTLSPVNDATSFGIENMVRIQIRVSEPKDNSKRLLRSGGGWVGA